MENAISAFVLSGDPQSLSVARNLLDHYPVRSTLCRTNGDAVTALKQKRFDLFILDFDLRGATALLPSAFGASYGHGRNLIVLAGDPGLLAGALQNKVKYALHKPVAVDMLSKTLQIIYSHIILEKRAYFRCPVRIDASAAYQQAWMRRALTDAVLQDISQTGLRLKANACLAKGTTAFIDFELPGTEDRIHVVGKAIWNDDNKITGLQFSYISANDLQRLRDWLNKRCPWASKLVPRPKAAPDVRLPLLSRPRS
jgi:hypothetical protein